MCKNQGTNGGYIVTECSVQALSKRNSPRHVRFFESSHNVESGKNREKNFLLRMDNGVVRTPMPRRSKVCTADNDLLPMFPIWQAGEF